MKQPALPPSLGDIFCILNIGRGVDAAAVKVTATAGVDFMPPPTGHASPRISEFPRGTLPEREPCPFYSNLFHPIRDPDTLHPDPPLGGTLINPSHQLPATTSLLA